MTMLPTPGSSTKVASILILFCTALSWAEADQAPPLQPQQKAPAQEAALVEPERSVKARERIGEIDASLCQKEWVKAQALSRETIETLKDSFLGRELAGAVARLAVAEAGLGQQQEAIWHWQVAQNLDRGVLPKEALLTYGPPAEVLERYRLRELNEAPAGATVYRAGDLKDPVQPARKLQGESPELSKGLREISAPKWVLLQAIVGEDGRLRDPVAIGSLPGMVYETLEDLRTWRFEPAKRAGVPVAAFYELAINPPSKTPLSRLVRLEKGPAEVEALLRGARWKEAWEASVRLLGLALDEKAQDGLPLGTLLALRALAEAGLGAESRAVCRWQAAQHLAPILYHADLSAYGRAGALLQASRWTWESGEPSGSGAGTPSVARRIPLRYPGVAQQDRIVGAVTVEGVIDSRGGVRVPVVTANPSRMLNLSASALDSFCGWSFQPVLVAGSPASTRASITLGFGNPDSPLRWSTDANSGLRMPTTMTTPGPAVPPRL